MTSEELASAPNAVTLLALALALKFADELYFKLQDVDNPRTTRAEALIAAVAGMSPNSSDEVAGLRPQPQTRAPRISPTITAG